MSVSRLHTHVDSVPSWTGAPFDAHPVATSQTLMVWSRLADANCASLGRKRTAEMEWSCPWNVLLAV